MIGASAEKRANASPRFRVFTPSVISLGVLIFILNAAICREIFRVDYTRHMDSIEALFIGISRFVMTHKGAPDWFPLWYCGIPFENSYLPLFPRLAAIFGLAFHVSPGLAYHAVSGFFYCAGPAALFFLAYALSRDLAVSLAAALISSLLSPSLFLMPRVHADMGSLWLPRRLQALVTYGEGPHVTAMTLLILAIAALHLAFEKSSAARIAIASIMFAATAATNWLGAFALALATFSYLLARWDDGVPLRRMVAIMAPVCILGYGLIAPWIPPSTIDAVHRNAQLVVGRYPMGAAQAIYGGLLLAVLVGLRWALVRWKAPLLLRFAAYSFLLTGGIALIAEWFRVYVMPQPERYHLEMEFAAALIVAVLGALLAPRTPPKVRASIVAALVIFGVLQFRHYRHYARHTLEPIDIHQTVEYQAGTWLGRNLPGRRVFATGSVQFWLTAFSDNPEIGGADDQSIIDPEIPAMTYGIPYTTGNGADTAMWVRLLGAKAIVVSEKNGRDAYNFNWRDPRKFHGVLPELWRSGGDVIYGVPVRSDSLAHAVPPADIVWQPPINVLDLNAARKLDGDIEDPSLPVAALRWNGESNAHISGALRPDEDLFVQIAWHPGWRAEVNSKPLPIQRDGLGFMVLEPHCNGPCQVDLTFDGGAEMRIARILRIMSALVLLILLTSPLILLTSPFWPRRSLGVQE